MVSFILQALGLSVHIWMETGLLRLDRVSIVNFCLLYKWRLGCWVQGLKSYGSQTSASAHKDGSHPHWTHSSPGRQECSSPFEAHAR